jgi:hypothetical protein
MEKLEAHSSRRCTAVAQKARQPTSDVPLSEAQPASKSETIQ